MIVFHVLESINNYYSRAYRS